MLIAQNLYKGLKHCVLSPFFIYNGPYKFIKNCKSQTFHELPVLAVFFDGTNLENLLSLCTFAVLQKRNDIMTISHQQS